ncbi:hypothetical protein [Janthinobacterium lividum]|uniref:DUF4817 domain-containing protein n=1 Tax=Janthinobacterium lividum TaxID=29581 RepID=A0ABU0XQ19_9BURK|nr:hypothetical protein [Janthinobacterium lividum]MDQ4625258.1 hypothetical protein [Janthinobacterium lividum]MDQ4673139.1 hypothetical protein [Janthinobacterium lividum]MDQ4683868.1 hypothetical protein [Janthinobacterium lividum]
MTLNNSETVRMAYAVKLTNAQVEAAKRLYAAHFGATHNPQAMAAIIAALARNYSSAVAANVL